MQDTQTSLSAFLLDLEMLDKNGQYEAFDLECQHTGGSFICPDPQDNRQTHLFELNLYGIYATGVSMFEVTRHWKTMARKVSPIIHMTSAVLPLATKIAAQESKLAEANAILANIAHHPDGPITNACNVIIELSRDMCIRQKATELLRVMQPAT